MERSAPGIVVESQTRLPCRLPRKVSFDGDVCIPRRIEPVDALQDGPRDFDGRDLTGADEFTQLRNAQEDPGLGPGTVRALTWCCRGADTGSRNTRMNERAARHVHLEGEAMLNAAPPLANGGRPNPRDGRTT